MIQSAYRRQLLINPRNKKPRWTVYDLSGMMSPSEIALDGSIVSRRPAFPSTLPRKSPKMSNVCHVVRHDIRVNILSSRSRITTTTTTTTTLRPNSLSRNCFFTRLSSASLFESTKTFSNFPTTNISTSVYNVQCTLSVYNVQCTLYIEERIYRFRSFR